MQPIQTWLPRLGGSIHRRQISRDSTRVFQHWRGELVVWMIPDFPAVRRWGNSVEAKLAVPAERFEWIDIVHVSEQGDIYAPTRADLPPSVDGLLDAWLNLDVQKDCEYVPMPEVVRVEVPEIDPADGAIRIAPCRFYIDAGAYIPVASVDETARSVELCWPPPGSPETISPEAESAERFPSERLKSDPSTAITNRGDEALHVRCKWPPPFTSIMPVLSGPDDLFAQNQMARIARRSSDLSSALREARLRSRPYLSAGETTVQHLWFGPTLSRKGPKQVLFEAEDLGLFCPARAREKPPGQALEAALRQQAWQRKLAESAPVRRAWGATGLFWLLLLDRLENQQSFRICERCGRILSGKVSKRFCGRDEGLQCFRARRAASRRELRRTTSTAGARR